MAKVKDLLDRKLSAGDNTVDIKKLAHFCCTTELIARQYITLLEAEHYYQKQFVIINGGKEYEEIDTVRASAIQERAESKN